MPRNIEIKARLRDAAEWAAVAARAQALAGAPGQRIEQDDAFYPVPQGRLKLRRFADGTAELIQYQRADGGAARASDYRRVPVPDADALHAALKAALGDGGRVRKQRLLFLHGPTRIHLDEVAGLGHFMELEVVLHEGLGDAEGHRIAEGLMRELGLQDAPRVAVAYRDLLATAASPAGAVA